MEKFRYSVDKLETIIPMTDFINQCVDIPRIHSYCLECPAYGHSWSCPPFSFDPAEIWGKYKSVRIIALKINPDSVNQEISAALMALEEEKYNLLDFLLEQEKLLPGSIALASGSCKLCPTCARQLNQQCLMPNKMRNSLESLGADVSKTVELYLNLPLQWIKQNELPQYFILVGALLIPDYIKRS